MERKLILENVEIYFDNILLILGFKKKEIESIKFNFLIAKDCE